MFRVLSWTFSRFAVRFQSPRNRVLCSVRRFFQDFGFGIRSFNPLEIGSCVPCWKIFIHLRQHQRVFQSPRNRVLCSVEIRYETCRFQQGEFQSPRNRVLCSVRLNLLVSVERLKFQSPRNRVLCSVETKAFHLYENNLSFNPLEIGSCVPCSHLS